MKLGLKLKEIKKDTYHFTVPLRDTEIIIEKEKLIFGTSITLDYMLAYNDTDIKKVGDALRSDNVNKDAFKYFIRPDTDNMVMVLLSDLKFRKVMDACIENYLNNDKDLLTELAKRYVYINNIADGGDVSVLFPLYKVLIETVLKEATK